MKKLRPVFFAVLTGCLCAFFLFKEVESRTLDDISYNAVAIQIGVFKDKNTAEELKAKLGGVVVLDDDIYRIYYSVLNRDENIEFMTDYLSKKGISYYLKDIRLKDELASELKEYERLMIKTNEESKLSINEEILNRYKEVI